MVNTKLLDKISGQFFLSGFILGKLRFMPVAIVSSIAEIASLLFYLTAYCIWLVSSHFYPEHKKHEEWYGFTQFKEQHFLAASLGIVASALNIAGIIFPVLLLPATWLFLAGNVIWSISEYHKLNNPMPDPNYAHSHQKSYVGYAIATTAISLVAALSATLIFFIPAITLPALAVTLTITLGLGALTSDYWLNCNYNTHKKTPVSVENISVENNSYELMRHSLGESVATKMDYSPEPYHDTQLLKTKPCKTPEATHQIAYNP